VIPLKPVYGLDQTRGPVNEVEACRERRRRLLAGGSMLHDTDVVARRWALLGAR
jgi:hypothetical protein